MISRGKCAVCGRQSRGLVRYKIKGGKLSTDAEAVCSTSCMEIAMKDVLPINADEDVALEAGGASGGQYLDSLGKTDLRDLTRKEYQQFLRCVLLGYSDQMKTFAEEIPF